MLPVRRPAFGTASTLAVIDYAFSTKKINLGVLINLCQRLQVPLESLHLHRISKTKIKLL